MLTRARRSGNGSSGDISIPRYAKAWTKRAPPTPGSNPSEAAIPVVDSGAHRPGHGRGLLAGPPERLHGLGRPLLRHRPAPRPRPVTGGPDEDLQHLRGGELPPAHDGFAGRGLPP